jgi:hypothetical protein
MSVVATLALVSACSSQKSLEPPNLAYLASVSPVAGKPTTFNISVSVRNGGSNTVLLSVQSCALGFRGYPNMPPVTQPAFESDALVACTLEIRAPIELAPGATYAASAERSTASPIAPGVYWITATFQSSGVTKEIAAGTIDIR